MLEDFLKDPRINTQEIRDRWGNRIPCTVKKFIQNDLEFLNENKEVEINCKFYVLGKCKQTQYFSHHSPEWNIEATEKNTNNKVKLRYCMKKFYLN